MPAQKTIALPELLALEALIDAGRPYLERHQLGIVNAGEGGGLPLLAVTLGNPDPAVPAVGFFGGVHGLERIGAEVVMAFLASLVSRLRWDSSLHRSLESVRIVFMPLVNPGGLQRATRANPKGVDLMRNAPVQAAGPVPWLVGGQRISAKLPWFRGELGAAMEIESQALCDFVEREMLTHSQSIAVDCHSGFGLADRIWFPFAHTAKPIPHLPEMHALCEILDQTHVQHRYVFEPQSRQYLTHGDIWDHLYMQACGRPNCMLLPLTLEMGSWLWVKKNPRQLFTRSGMFNPLVEHRQQRVLRRHLAWLDFVLRAAAGMQRWLPLPERRAWHEEMALNRWYRGQAAQGFHGAHA
ncbi:zinc carboxypeptidase [Paucibacter sp. TC2R-5]|uniref:M14 family zinc carboxypeptidase n=1 Tax=Paucibacter sp. TC2R-5 TaxID=2893555 RepID=UPI0021E37122|nr:M14 family zinc carboxypeptidase [Paucibacter sp. TC2R-5]MCV2358819.1 zinc carboxypeptidase [Paucibacter sp. TC2R-5]